MTVQELQQQYAIGNISYDDYINMLNDIRHNTSEITQHNNSWYFIAGIGVISVLILYLSKRKK